jgi:hypothetical protein
MTEPAQSPELARLPEFEKAVLRVRDLSLWYGATQARSRSASTSRSARSPR